MQKQQRSEVESSRALVCGSRQDAGQGNGYPLWAPWSLILLACSQLAGCSVTGSGSKVPAGVDLSGQWQLNVERSDNIDDLIASVKEELDPPPRRGGTAGGADASGRIFGRRDEFYGPPRTKELLALLKQPTAFSLTQSMRSMTMKSIDGTTEFVFGQSAVVSLPDGVGDRYCGWTGAQFAVSIRAVDGRKIQYLLGLSQDRAQLQLTTTVSGGGLPSVMLKRSYDRLAAG